MVDKTSQPADNANLALPEDVLIVLPVRNLVMFPGVAAPLTVGRARSLTALQEAQNSGRNIGLLLQRDPSVDEPGAADLHRVGTVANILRHGGDPQQQQLIVQGRRRFRVLNFLDGFPFLVARIDPVHESELITPALEARHRVLQKQAIDALQLLPQAPAELLNAVQGAASPGLLADMITGLLDIDPEQKQAVLATIDLEQRLDLVSGHLARRIEVLKLTRQIDQQTKESLDERQREMLLREQLKTIHKELGEDQPDDELQELGQAIDAAGMPEDVERQAKKEFKRLQKMPEAAGEHAMLRGYLDWLVALPWAKLNEEHIDIAAARAVLDQDHYGLDKIKRRILEYLAVRKLNPAGRSPILCFVGPPGVGKTSLGKSIARAVGLEFVRGSLGGVHDEAEIRGHRRTYMGALPGNIIQSLRKADSRNPVFMLDEIDKLGGGGFHGDPSAALLEVLDPEQNGSFRDNYLGVDFDLSKVFFIATANVLDAIPGPLRDRMEVIELPGYTEDEKVQIARRYLVDRQLAANGLNAEQASVSDAALTAIVRDYTREAGCRNLERQLGAVMRNAAMQISEHSTSTDTDTDTDAYANIDRIDIDEPDLAAILGPRRFESEVALRTSLPGVATGLAWTPVGGDILFIETSRMPGSGKLILTGQLGDVMKESAQAALSLIKARAAEFDIGPDAFERSDIHLHVPAGAIPKDGPSAGVAMFTSLTSLLSGRTVRADVAMTGEISLRGLVLPVGGIKEKCLAALRAGVTTVMLPARNRKDLEDIPQDARDKLNFIWLERVDDAIRAAVGPAEVDLRSEAEILSA